jgi:hypothetical protein
MRPPSSTAETEDQDPCGRGRPWGRRSVSCSCPAKRPTKPLSGPNRRTTARPRRGRRSRLLCSVHHRADRGRRSPSSYSKPEQCACPALSTSRSIAAATSSSARAPAPRSHQLVGAGFEAGNGAVQHLPPWSSSCSAAAKRQVSRRPSAEKCPALIAYGPMGIDAAHDRGDAWYASRGAPQQYSVFTPNSATSHRGRGDRHLTPLAPSRSAPTRREDPARRARGRRLAACAARDRERCRRTCRVARPFRA